MRTRLPVKVKVAVVTAALTFVILCLFAAVIGAVAERRITGGFENDLRATSADLVDQLEIEQNAAGGYRLKDESIDDLRVFASGGAAVRVLNGNGDVVFRTSPANLGPPIEGVTDAGDFRVVSRRIVVPEVDRRERSMHCRGASPSRSAGSSMRRPSAASRPPSTGSACSSPSAFSAAPRWPSSAVSWSPAAPCVPSRG